MAATKLRLYNDSLRALADARLSLITDDVESRYALDDAWDEAVAFTLRQAPWRFALKTVTLAGSAEVFPGYSNAYAVPADWLRTHAIFLSVSGREIPLDLKESGLKVYTNSTTAPVMRYVSSDYTNVELAGHPWPEHAAQCLAVYLAFLVAERVTGERSAPKRMSDLFASLLGEAVRIDAVPEDPWLPFQRSGAFLRVARTMTDEGFWRFAMPAPTEITTVAGGGGGFSRQAAFPAGWSRTRALYRINDAGQKRPIDIRERNGLWLTNETSFWAEYVSSTLAMDARNWPDHYMRAALRQLQFDAANLAGDNNAQQADGAVWKDALAATLDSEADPPDPWLAHQLSGVFARCVPAVMSRGYWKFALKSQQFTAETDQETTPVPDPTGYPYRLDQPADWFKTHAIFVPWHGSECPIDIKEHEGKWSTAAKTFVARYVSTAALDPLQWPDAVADAVRAYLDYEAATGDQKKLAAEVWAEALDAALTAWSLPEHRWLRFQLDGRYAEALDFVLGAARWRFAIKTVTLTADRTLSTDGTLSGDPIPTGIGDGSISPSYTAYFVKPGDWLRTLWMYRTVNNPQVNLGEVFRDDIDYRDEGGAWHTNFDTIQVRYLSLDAFDSTRGPASFRNAVLAWLEYEEARANPKLGALAQSKLKIYEDAIQRAESEDDTREMPPVNNTGRFVRARRGSFWNGSSGAGTIITS